MTGAKTALDAMAVPSTRGGEAPEGSLDDSPPNKLLGPYEGRSLGDYFGLTQFGVAMEILAPGSKSSMRHWHTKSDEFIMVLEGTLVLVTDEQEVTMTPGMISGFKAADENAHHLINRSDLPARFIVVGSRVPGDEAHYPDDDFQWLQNKDGTRSPARKDGTKY